MLVTEPQLARKVIHLNRKANETATVCQLPQIAVSALADPKLRTIYVCLILV